MSYENPAFNPVAGRSGFILVATTAGLAFSDVSGMDIKINERVKITTGPLMDQEGKVLSVRHKTAQVAIDSLGYTLVDYIDRSKLTSARP